MQHSFPLCPPPAPSAVQTRAICRTVNGAGQGARACEDRLSALAQEGRLPERLALPFCLGPAGHLSPEQPGEGGRRSTCSFSLDGTCLFSQLLPPPHPQLAAEPGTPLSLKYYVNKQMSDWLL